MEESRRDQYTGELIEGSYRSRLTTNKRSIATMKLSVTVPDSATGAEISSTIAVLVAAIEEIEFPESQEGWEVKFEREETDEPDKEGAITKVQLVLSRQRSSSFELEPFNGNGGADSFAKEVIKRFVEYWNDEITKRNREISTLQGYASVLAQE